MSSLEQEILQHISKLNPDNQQRVLDFVIELENQPALSAQELMKLPIEARQRQVMAAIQSAANEDFETFEAYAYDEVLSTVDVSKSNSYPAIALCIGYVPPSELSV